MIFDQTPVKFYVIFQILVSVTYTNGYDCNAEADFIKHCNKSVTHSYDYTDFFPINKDDNENTNISLIFYVKGERDAHILLSSAPKLGNSKEQDKTYEIVLGVSNNTGSTIRLKRLVGGVGDHEQNIISPDEWREFWIKVSSDGLIQVGRRRESVPFMSRRDPDPLQINYYSFSSYYDHDVYWLHQCSNQTEDPIIKYYEEKLESHLFSNYSKQTRPTQVNTNSTQMKIFSWYVDLDTTNGIFELRGRIFIKWLDERLTWKPNEHGGQDSLNITKDMIWTPGILLTNQAFVHDGFLGFGVTTVSNEGVILHKATSNIHSQCQISTNSRPLDTYTCQLNFTMKFHANIFFSHLKYSDVISPWIITNTQPIYSLEQNETEPLKESVSIQVTLRRNISQPMPTSCSEFANNSSEKLGCRLFSSYNSSVSPDTTSQDHFHALKFMIFYADIDVSGTFQLVGDVNVKWEDHRLTWEPSEYNDTHTIDIQNYSHQLWKPDFELANGAFRGNKPLFGSDQITNISVTYQGIVTFWTSISIQARCKVTVKSRPWKNHTCQLHFKSNTPKFNVECDKESLKYYENSTGVNTDIQSPWTVHEIREVTPINGTNESSNYSMSVDVELHRNLDRFKSTRCTSFANSYEEELKCHLFSKVKHTFTLDVFINGPELDMTISYVDLNIENRIFQMKGELVLKWTDERMAWDPEKFGNQFVLNVEEDAIWTPYLILKNELFETYLNDEFLGPSNYMVSIKGELTSNGTSVVDKFQKLSRDSKSRGAGHLEVSSNGDLTWTLPMIIDTRCNMTPNSWPWDPQKCELNFTTNTLDMHLRVNYTSQELPPAKISLWEITETFKESNVFFKLRFLITLEKKSNSLQVVLCLTFIGVSLVLLPSFLISPINKIKLASKTLSLLLLVIFLVILISSIPHFTTQAPNFLIGLVMLLLIVGISSCVTAYFVRFARKTRSYNPSLNMKSTNLEENKYENDAMKTALIETTTYSDEKYTTKVSKESQNEWLKIAVVIEFSSFAICLIVVVFLIISLMS